MSNVNNLRWGSCGHVHQGGWSIAWSQIIGRHHPKVTEDTVAYCTTALAERGFALSIALADGVSGGARGDIASRALANHCIRAPRGLLSDAQGLAEWMRMAEGEVQLKLREVSCFPGASTLAAAWLMPDGFGHLIHVGDARAYLYSDRRQFNQYTESKVTALTIDHTYARDIQYRVGKALSQGGGINQPARMIGTGFMGEPEIASLQLQHGQTLILSSDGLHCGLEDLQMRNILDTVRNQGEVARTMVTVAREQGSDDDISVLIATRTSLGRQHRTLSSNRLSKWWQSVRFSLWKNL